MRLPRLILNPSIRPWIFLWQAQRKETARLRRELIETRAERDAWRDKLLLKVNVTSLFTPPPPPPKPAEPLIVGPTALRGYLESQRGPNNTPTAEEILAAAERSNGNQ